MLTPQEVASHAFARATIGGYNMGQVDEFLDLVTEDYSALYKENAALKGKMKVLTDTIEKYRATDGAKEFRIMYQASEYEACVAGNKANLTYIDPTGAATDANDKAFRLVLAQVGGCDTMLTDSQGTACGNLTVFQLG